MKRPRFGPLSGQSFTVTATEAVRFWGRVDRRGADECWPWIGTRNHKTEYGVMTLHRVRRGSIHAHRIAWVIANGRQIPTGLCILHACDNKICVNPAHLSLGTHQQNIQQAWDRGRIPLDRVCEVMCVGCGAPARNNGGHYRCPDCKSLLQALREAKATKRARAKLRACPPSTFDALVAATDIRRATIYSRYFGLYDRDPEFLEEIASTYSLTRERVRQLVADTSEKLLRGCDHVTHSMRLAA